MGDFARLTFASTSCLPDMEKPLASLPTLTPLQAPHPAPHHSQSSQNELLINPTPHRSLKPCKGLQICFGWNSNSRCGSQEDTWLCSLPSRTLPVPATWPARHCPPKLPWKLPPLCVPLSGVLVWLLFGYATTEGIAGPAKIKNSLFKSQSIVYSEYF